ncbi:hypothetical protein KUA23_20770 [Pseudomonas pergaminensis]|uniref:Protein FlhE n=1 Tax=Pseudomonas pergaminensis TaxID=2853159 RepID=A0ABD7TCR9_9PSED|nr:hypothetical protein [Pseudomonas pergaminensis]USV99455.1 hypothetical protein KUA23_20770 [Pseudomonas pergaminensis]
MKSSKSINKIWLAVGVVLTFFTKNSVLAAEGVFTKTVAPTPVLVLSNSNTVPSREFANFSVLAADIPSGTLQDPKQISEIRWSTTYYPGTLSEKVELCYFRSFSAEKDCRDIFPSSSGVLMDFNNQSFGHGSKVTIFHTVLGGTPPYARPAGVDSVTIKYSY